jgi:PKD repeat protein
MGQGGNCRGCFMRQKRFLTCGLVLGVLLIAGATVGTYAASAAKSVSTPSCVPEPSKKKKSATCSASFADIKKATCTVDFGDGTTVPGVISATGKDDGICSASHVYTAKGTYTVTVTVSDEKGKSLSNSGSHQVR